MTQSGPTTRAASCVAMATIQSAKVSGAPTSASDRNLHAADGHVPRSPVRAVEAGLGEAQPDDGQLRRRQGQEDAEAVEAPEEAHVATGDVGDEQQGRGETGGAEYRRRGEQRPPVQASERVRQHLVPPERVGEPPGARDRRRDRGDEYDGGAETDEDPQGVDGPGGQLPLEGVDDRDERRLELLLNARRPRPRRGRSPR